MKGEHLRLVPAPSSSAQETSGSTHKQVRVSKNRILGNAQLSLPLDDIFEAKRVILIPLDVVHGEQLIELLCDAKPRIIIDVRSLIRFNLPGMNRELIFKKFYKLSSMYIRESIKWESVTSHDVMVGNYEIPTRICYELLNMHHGCALLMTEKQAEARMLASALNRFLSADKNSNWVIERMEGY